MEILDCSFPMGIPFSLFSPYVVQKPTYKILFGFFSELAFLYCGVLEHAQFDVFLTFSDEIFRTCF